jgi:hypothetical protein
MTNQDKIDELLARAEPLRLLPDDEAEGLGLPGIVNEINALRKLPPGDDLADAEPKQSGRRPKK